VTRTPHRFLTQIILFIAVCIVLGAAPAVHAKENGIVVRTTNFTLVGNAGEKDMRLVATRLEQFRDVFTRLLPTAKHSSPVPTTVLVFKSMSSYKPFMIPGTAGYFQKGEDVNYITLTTELGAQSPFSTIYHEYVHQLVDNTAGNVPVWFNEGLAEYYSTFEIEDDRKVHLGELIPYHLQTLREERMLPLRRLFEVDQYSPEYNEGSKRGMLYAESWALVHYMILGNNGERLPQFSKFLRLTAANVPLNEAFKQSFQTEVETMEKELKKYVEGHSFRMQIATFEHKLEVEGEITVTPLTEADAQAYLGDLLLHVNRLSDAETRLQQALTLDAKQPMAQASLGILRARQGKFAEAKQHLREAVSANSSSYLAHYYYAYALSREGMDANDFIREYTPENAAIIRAELKKAIELNPNFTESYSLLAFVNMVRGEELDASIDLLKKALTLSPGRQDLAFHLAQIYMRQQKFDIAKQILEPLREAKDRQLKLQAEGLLKSIKNYEDTVAAYNSGPGAPRLQRRNDQPAEVVTEEQPRSASDYLQDALRPLEAGEERIQGLFVKLECDNKAIAYFIVQVADRLYKIRATSLERIILIAYTTDAGSQLTCGSRKALENVVITFRPVTDPKDRKAKIDGDAIAVEMVPKDFVLKK
jgi:tetratricopeptide (TPR) repeat protein